MFRNIMLSTLAAATLAGCATGYSYRNGNGGDYYYGQPRTEYRYYDPYGFQGIYGYGSYGPGYYYDRYGRLVYGNPYGYYGTPYGYGSWWYRPRPPHGHDGDHHDDHPGDGDRDGRRPPWRNIGGVLPPGERSAVDGDDARPPVRRQQSPYTRPMPAPQREQRMTAPPAPRMRSDEGGGSRMGRAIRGAKSSSDE
ncbi:MAG TPA: hypothetical protein VN205_01810 [Thermomonas sp.]|nr:hypothetical protein [Thermomonas sp.]